MFANMPDVTKNLVIINALFFLATIVMGGQGLDLHHLLGMHYPASPFFEPYQIVTHFFMHSNLFHLLFNMIGLVVFGSHLERTWGKKRFFIFYLVTALGAAILHFLVQGIEIYQMTGEWFPLVEYLPESQQLTVQAENVLNPDADWDTIMSMYVIPTVGASGAVYGLLTAFALLFPNTQFMLLFPPIPVKAKWLAIALGGIALFQGFQNNPTDSIAHFAHLGGMLFAFILIQIWKRDNKNFY
jgi:membrane associated rhomboid family serine protease